MEFHEVARTWGPVGNSTLLDDSQATYAGPWTAVDDDGAYLGRFGLRWRE